MKVGLVEDDPGLRAHLEILLAGEPGMELVASCGTAAEALALLPPAAPDVIVVDLGLPDMEGPQLIRRLRQAVEAELLAHTVFDDGETVFAALRAGACGYLLKGCPPRELVEALHDLASGGAPMTPRIARRVLRELQGVAGTGPLTAREAEILRELAAGRSYKEAAERLHLSRHTIHAHVKRIYEKLQVDSREDAVAKARREGLL